MGTVLGLHIIEPISIQFNVAVKTLAHKFCPLGWVGSANAPDTLDKLRLSIRANRGTVVVSNEHCSSTIFDDEEINMAFRAWHDAVHARYGYEFTPTGEFQTFMQQALQIMEEYGYNEVTKKWIDLLDIEINQQVRYEKRHGMFPVNQKLFAQMCLLNGADAAIEMEL